jgi:hypothetical protein
MQRRDFLAGMLCALAGHARARPQWYVGQRVVCTNNDPTPVEIKCGETRDSRPFGPWYFLKVGETYVIADIFYNQYTSDEDANCDGTGKPLLSFSLKDLGGPFWEGRFTATEGDIS